jgi:hypothetical protein
VTHFPTPYANPLCFLMIINLFIHLFSLEILIPARVVWCCCSLCTFPSMCLAILVLTCCDWTISSSSILSSLPCLRFWRKSNCCSVLGCWFYYFSKSLCLHCW